MSKTKPKRRDRFVVGCANAGAPIYGTDGWPHGIRPCSSSRAQKVLKKVPDNQAVIYELVEYKPAAKAKG